MKKVNPLEDIIKIIMCSPIYQITAEEVDKIKAGELKITLDLADEMIDRSEMEIKKLIEDKGL